MGVAIALKGKEKMIARETHTNLPHHPPPYDGPYVLPIANKGAIKIMGKKGMVSIKTPQIG